MAIGVAQVEVEGVGDTVPARAALDEYLSRGRPVLAALVPIAGATKAALFNTIAGGGAPVFAGSLDGAYFFFLIVIYINVLLGIFNLVPIPPLDGSKLLFLVLPPTPGTYKFMYFMERWGLILVLIFVFFGFQIIFPVINFFFSLFAGRW